MNKMLWSLPAAIVAICAVPASLLAQPSWTDFTYTDWNPGQDPAVKGTNTERHYECRTVWDGTQFVNIHEQDRTAPVNYSYWISYSSDGMTWSTPTAIDVPRNWDCGQHAVACDPDNFPPGDTMNGDTNIKFKLWYAEYGDNSKFRYAESSDGITWNAAPEGDYCPPKYKVSDFDTGAYPNTTKVMIKPDVLYRPDGSATLDLTDPMANRYICYLGAGADYTGGSGYFEMYLSHNGLEWKLYAWDQQCQNRWNSPGPGGPAEVSDIITFNGCSCGSDYQFTCSLEEVYENGVRQGFMLWTDRFLPNPYPIYSFYSTNGVDWICRGDPIETIGTINDSSIFNWNYARNYDFDSVRLGESYFITRSGWTDNPSASYSFGAAVIKGKMSVEVETPASPGTGNIPISYDIYSWDAQTCSLIEATYSTDGTTFLPAAMGSGGDGTTNLATAIGGESHTFAWDSLADLPYGAEEVHFRVQPMPGGTPGSYDTTGPFKLVGASTPTPTPVTPTVTPTPTPEPPNYINLTANPTGLSPGDVVTLGWQCDFSRWDYHGIPVNIYLAAIKTPKVVDAPSSVKDALDGGTVYLAGPKMKSVYVFRGRVKEPTWSRVLFPPVKTAGSINIRTPWNPAIAGDYVFATAFIYTGGRFVRDDGLPVENSNLFSIK